MVRYIPPYDKYNTHALTSVSLFARLLLTLASAQSHSTQGVLIMSSAKERKNRKERIKRRDQKNVRSRTPEEMARDFHQQQKARLDAIKPLEYDQEYGLCWVRNRN